MMIAAFPQAAYVQDRTWQRIANLNFDCRRSRHFKWHRGKHWKNIQEVLESKDEDFIGTDVKEMLNTQPIEEKKINIRGIFTESKPRE